MLNYLWAGMTLTGVLWGAFHGQLSAVTDGALQASKGGNFMYYHAGSYDTLDGSSGDSSQGRTGGSAVKKMSPVLNFLFPRLPPEGEARKQIAVNMIANVLGLGWAATPAGLRAMEELKKVEEMQKKSQNQTGARKAQPPGTASNEMCTFLIINISSLQLIPMNMIAYRSQYGSVAPGAIVGPALVATLISTVVAVIYCKIMDV